MAGYGKAPAAPPTGGEMPMKDLASALEETPDEVEPDADVDDALDPEQASLAEEMGLSPEQGLALRRFVETMM